MSVVSFLLAHKILVIFILASTALGISTIYLGVDNSKLRSDLSTLQETAPGKAPPTPTTPPVTNPVRTTTEKPSGTTILPPEMSKFRLPTAVIPNSYDLFLYPDLKTGLFNGKITTEATVKEATSSIVMHSNKLNISKIVINGQEGQFQTDEAYETITMKLKDETAFQVGSNVKVEVTFNGDMKNRIVGLYSSSYINGNNDTRFIATSKFEPTYARQAYPCFDEPNLKATYKIHLLKPNVGEYIALSNYPQIATETTVSDGIMVDFETTVPMSTYLACFIVSDFKHTQTTFANGDVNTLFRVYATPEQLNKTTYAGEVGKTVIEYYIDFFNISYPLPKLDLVAIPDFVSGAMEHWGLVTFRETTLLYSSETHSSANQQRVAEVVAHELAHSWFGNLVTMDWWDNLWLNEGFATYIEYKGINKVEPTWGMLDQFLIGTLHAVLSLDATQASHPIIQTVQTPDQITEVFDTISYNKGASVLRMLEHVVGEDTFREGVTNYLRKHAYKNAVTTDLWEELQKVVGETLDIYKFMDTYTVQMGYPIIDVKVDGNKYTFTQKRFLTDYSTSANGKSSPLNYKWTIPIEFITNTEKSPIHWFHHDTNELVIEIPAGTQWVKFNPGQFGYYRVNYVEQDWQKLIDNIEEFSVADRTHLLEEAFSIAESGDLNFKMALDFTKYLVNETDYVPWSVASSKLGLIARYLKNSRLEAQFKQYVVRQLKPTYTLLGWEEDSTDDHLQKLARVVILNLACSMDDEDALKEASARFKQWIDNTSESLAPNLRSVIYKYGMVNADEETWNKLLDLFTKETDANEKLKLMNGLASVRNPALLNRLIQLAATDGVVRSQDYFTLLSYISANQVGTPIVWDYVRENWITLVERFTLNDRYLGRLIPSITNRFASGIKVDEMNSFYQKYPEAGAGAAARLQALETVNNNINWLAKYKSVVEEWIEIELNN